MEASILSITRRLGVYGPVVLLARGWIEELPRTAPGQPRRFLLRQTLPHEQQFEAIFREHYTHLATERIAVAFRDLETLGDEMMEWYERSPERLLPAERLERIGGIAQLLAEVQRPEIPTTLDRDALFRSLSLFMAPELGSSRTIRHTNAVRSLAAVAQALRHDYRPPEPSLARRLAAETLASELMEIVVGPLADLRYPTRYS